MKSLSSGAKLYIALTALAGISIWAFALVQGQWNQSLRFAFYLMSAVLASRLKVVLPGVTGTMSVNFVFILVCVTELSLAQTLTVGTAASFAQCFWGAKRRPRPVQVAFNLSSLVIASAMCYFVFHSPHVRRLDNTLPILLFFTSLAFFLANTASVSGIISLTEVKPFGLVWRESFFWTAPQYLVGAALAGVVHAFNGYAGWQVSVMTLPVIYLVYRSYRLYLGRLEEEQKHVSEMSNLHLRTIGALALAIDAKDDTTHDHLIRVQVYATEIGKDLNLSPEETRALEAAALLHDIGKLAVPEYIISKPGRLTPEEFEKMKIHPVVGAEILESVQFPYPVVPIVRSHHEKWNGTGYPSGLKGEEIPIGARILAAVDCLDALASDRQYRRALPLNEAMQKVASESGTSFDPKVIEVLQRRYIELEAIAKASPVPETKLSTNAKIERGEAPAAGFEKTAENAPSPNADPVDFLSLIAAARQEFQMLLEVTNELGKSLSVDDTLSLLAQRLKRMIPYDCIAIYVRKDDYLIPQYVNGENFRLFSSLEIPMGQGLSGWVAENKRPIVNGNPSVEPGYLNDPTKFSTLRSAVSVPLEGIAGVVGTLTLYHAEADAFTKDHLRILLAISSKAGLTIENALKYRQAETCAVTDELTGLPNARSLFLHLDAELARCRRIDAPLAVLVLDLDGFKQVNDRFGHLEGNEVLQLTAKGLKESCREYDYVARMGGDEFVVILPGMKPEVVRSRAKRLCEIVEEAGYRTLGERILSLSLGEAFFPDNGTDAEQLLAEADRRMYQAKRNHHIEVDARPRMEDFPVTFATIQ